MSLGGAFYSARLRLTRPFQTIRKRAEATAKEFERLNSPLVAGDIRIVLEKLKETRTIRIKGRNVDNLGLEKLGNLIQQANEKSSKVNLKDFLKRLKSSRTNDSQRE